MFMNEFQNKKILITGATGLIGRHLTEMLLSRGAKVIAIGRNKKKLEAVFDSTVGSDNLLIVEGDISKSFPVHEQDIDYVFHAASPISGVEIKTKPVDTISANIDGIRNCLEHLKNQGHGRLIVFSSATAYGNYSLSEDMTVTEEMTDKADALHTPNTPYSESKRMVEVLARAYGNQYSVDSVIARIAYVYGYSNPKPNTAFYEFIGKAINGEDIVLNSSGMGRRDNIHVNDVVNGLLIVAAQGNSGEAYNLSSNGDLENFRAIDEIAEIIADEASGILGKPVKAVIKPMEGQRKPGMKMDNTKAKDLGWNVNISLAEGIGKTVSAYFADTMR